MHSKSKDPASTRDPSHLGGHALESRSNPGAYVQNLHRRIQWRTIPDSKDHFANKYGAILRHGKIDVEQNDAQAREMNFGQWIEMCRDGGPWDYASAPVMQEGVRQGLYVQDLLVRFRGFHIGRSGAALGLILEAADEWIKHLGMSWSDEALRQDIRDGSGSYFRRSDPPPWD